MIIENIDKYNFQKLNDIDDEKLNREKFIMSEAQRYLDNHKITSVSIGKYSHTATCVERDGDFIYVYGAERDRKDIFGMFTSIYMALSFVSAICLNSHQFPINFTEINDAFDAMHK